MKPLVIFIHGTRSSAETWKAQNAFLKTQGHESISIDLPGHGKRKNEVFTLQGSYDLIDSIIAETDRKVVLVGMSLGGYVALGYAANHPSDRIESMILSACTTETKNSLVLLYRLITHKYSTSVKAMKKMLLKNPPLTQKADWQVVVDMLGEVGRMSSLENIKKITVPLWFVSGQRDILRLGELRTLAANPLNKRIIIKNAGHDVNLHAPSHYNNVLLSLLKKRLNLSQFN